MKAIHYFLIAAALFASCYGKAQATLKISPLALDSLSASSFVIGDSSSTNYPTIGMWLYNVSGNNFSDSITFSYAIDTGTGLNQYLALNTNNSGVNFNPQTVVIPAHDSLLVSGIHFEFGSPQFTIGSSTVVIWPVAYHGGSVFLSDFVLLDSASRQLQFTQYPAGIITTEAPTWKVYLSGQVLFIQNNNGNQFGGIRIYNSVGQILIAQNISQHAAIPMQQYAAGSYLVELTSADGERAVYKVLKNTEY
jgi:hypothetical protein